MTSAQAVLESPFGESIRAEVLSGSLTDSEATEEELREFLSADYSGVSADPEFERKLRDQLWTLVQDEQLTRQ